MLVQKFILYTGVLLYGRYSLLSISNKFCKGGGVVSSAVMLLYRTGGVEGWGGWGSSAVK